MYIENLFPVDELAKEIVGEAASKNLLISLG
jgi:hypothetical protein